MKLIMLILGAALGFGGGVWYGVHHPKEAADLAAKQEEWINQGKMQATQAVKERLDKILDKQKTAPAAGLSFTGGSSLLGSSGGTAADELKQLRDEQDKNLKEMAAKAKK
jgi:hypothetical protein